MKKIWRAFGSIRLTILVLWLLVGDLTGGYLSLKGSEKIFSPLNDLGLVEWVSTYGLTYPGRTIWLAGLFLLLLLLGLNTFACTTDRVASLVKNRRYFTARLRFCLKFSVHIMHYALLFILTGYLLSYLYAFTCSNLIVVLKHETRIPGTDIRVRLESLDIDYYRGERLAFLNDRAIDARAGLLFTSGRYQTVKAIALNQPCLFRDLSFHLDKFNPDSRTSMQKQPYIRLIVKKDPGLKLYFGGTLLFIIGLGLYLWQWFLLQPSKKEIL